jgi:hypothetical protein
MNVRKRREFGQYIVSDPEICHGHLTFKGARMLGKDRETKLYTTLRHSGVRLSLRGTTSDEARSGFGQRWLRCARNDSFLLQQLREFCPVVLTPPREEQGFRRRTQARRD